MEVRAIHKFARMRAFKVREVTREIQGMPANQALLHLSFVPRKSAVLVRKVLASAVANAENNNNADVSALVVKEAVVGEGPTLRRFKARARGSASRIRKRTSHIKVIVSDEITATVNKERSEKKKAAKPSSRKSAPKAEKAETATAEGEA
jgi:large subunit ribosomal protein L22